MARRGLEVRFVYRSGEPVMTDDVVTAAGDQARVAMVIQPNTQDAKDFSCKTTGGLLLKFDNGDVQLWPEVDEDLIFVRRRDET